MKNPKPLTYEEALIWINKQYKKNLNNNRVTKEFQVIEALVRKIHELRPVKENDNDTIF